jgi:hypothetical protein
MPIPSKWEILTNVELKTRRAQFHFDTFRSAVESFSNPPPYTVTSKTDFERVQEVWTIRMHETPEIIPMALGDFICCLRSALDQLAWGLAHLDTKRVFTEREQRNISFPIFKEDNPTYRDRLKLFPSAVAIELDKFQPYRRGNAYRDDLLWQLNELWTLDKHRTIPSNSHSFNVRFPLDGWERYLSEFDDRIIVSFPLLDAWLSPVNLNPSISFEILFGEYMGAFEISLAGLSEINDFVRNDVIPRFTGFFS